MRRAAVVLALSGCAMGACAKHPVVFITATAAVIAGGSCEMDDAPNKTCAITTGVVAAALGGLAALVTHFADTTAHAIPPDEELAPNGVVRLHTHTAPPPVELAPAVPSDAAAAPASAPVDAGVADAVVSPPDA